MPTITVTPYTFRVRERRKKGVVQKKVNGRLPFVPIRNFGGGGDIFDLFKSTLLDPGEQEVPGSQKKITAEISKNRDNFIDGRFSVGSSGFGSDFHDEKGEMVFKRERNHTEFVPLYFQLWVPDSESDYAILVLQSFDRFSVKTIINDLLLQKFSDLYPEMNLLFSRLFDTKQAKRAIKESPIKRARFIQRKVPKDQADLVRKGASDYDGEIELILKTKGDNPFGVRNAILSAIDGKTNINEIIEIEEFNFDDVKVELEIGGKKRTMSIARADHLNTSFDISEEIELDDRNHPIIDSIREYVSDLATTLKP